MYNNNKLAYYKFNLNLFNTNHVLIYWKPSINTILHYHPKLKCNFFILRGNLIEHRYINNNIQITECKSFNNYYIDDTIGPHILFNKNNYPCLSYHKYTPRINNLKNM